MGELLKMPEKGRVDAFRDLWKSCTRAEKDEIRAIVEGVAKNNRELMAEAKEVILFLNRKTGRNYQLKGSSLETVMARMRSGATMQEMKAVIAKKCMQWRDDEKMEAFLRPKTLFSRTNFENYLGEIGDVVVQDGEE